MSLEVPLADQGALIAASDVVGRRGGGDVDELDLEAELFLQLGVVGERGARREAVADDEGEDLFRRGRMGFRGVFDGELLA
jgi:hypothetical protein